MLVTSGSESDLKAAVASAGPVAVAVDASSKAFRVCTSNRGMHIAEKVM